MEINARVNYPVKVCLARIEESGMIDMESSIHKFCLSWFAIRVCCVGAKLAVEAWNEHPVPGKITQAIHHGIFNGIAACISTYISIAFRNYNISREPVNIS